MADKIEIRKRMIMSLSTPDLKRILDVLHLNKFGKKLELIHRLLSAVSKGIPDEIEREIEQLYKRRFNTMTCASKPMHMISKATLSSQHVPAHSSNAVNSSSMMMIGSQLPVHPDVKLKPLPFYGHIAILLKPVTLVPQTSSVCQELGFSFFLTPQQTALISSKNYENQGLGPESTQIQLRFCWLETSCEQDDNFPPSLNVRINNRILQLPNPLPTTKQGVEPKRPPQPLNITSLCKISPTVKNHIIVNWSVDYGRNYCLAVNLVFALNSDMLLQRMKQNGIRHPYHTRALIKEKLALDVDSEIATTSLRISLLCPLGKMRMRIPSRASTCNHLQCFDAPTFLQMNEKKPTWTCPVCDKPAEFKNLIIDGLFTEILRSASKAVEIQFTEDGEWQTANAAEDECYVRDSPTIEADAAAASTAEISNETVIDLTETDDEYEDDDESALPPPHLSSIYSSPPPPPPTPYSYSFSAPASPDRDSPVVIAIDTPPPPLRAHDSFSFREAFHPGQPRPPPAHSKVPVSSYPSGVRGGGGGGGYARPTKELYDGELVAMLNRENPLSLTIRRTAAHTNTYPKTHLYP